MPTRDIANQGNVNANNVLKTSRYRQEIDGLRAFAVVAVIINHFNKDILPGGYLGVDIFFVISGYVITSSLFGRPSKDFKDFISGFYERRIKRLVPALSVFVLITSIAICLFNPSPGTSLKTGLTSLFGLSNLYLLKNSTDYFAQSTELNVFTHTWSLGVEEQFYILFPFLIWFSGFGRQTKNGARNLFLIVGALTIASLIGFLYLYPTNQSAAYFLMPSRFWEMAAGCLIFIGFQKRASVEQLLEKVPPLVVLALIVGVMYLPKSLAAASTIAVVALTSILIASLKKQTAAFKVFTHPRVVYIGLISYSLYLWHWGVLSISRWTIGIHWWSVPFQVALMLGLAIGSYRWIETPLRKGNWFGRRWKTLIVGGGVLVTLSGGLLALGKPLKGKLYSGEQIKNFIPTSLRESCNDALKGKNIIFLGDSHTKQLEPLAKRLKDDCGAYAQAKMQGLFPVVATDLYGFGDKDKPSGYDLIGKGKELEKKYAKHLDVLDKGDFAVVSSRYLCRLRDRCFSVQLFWKDVVFADYQGEFINADAAVDLWIRKLREFTRSAHTKGIKVVLVLPTPEIRTSPTLCQKSSWFRPKFAIPESCKISEEVLTERHKFINKVTSSKVDNLNIFDPWNSACRGDESCEELIPYIDLKDATHLSERSIDRFTKEFLSFILSEKR